MQDIKTQIANNWLESYQQFKDLISYKVDDNYKQICEYQYSPGLKCTYIKLVFTTNSDILIISIFSKYNIQMRYGPKDCFIDDKIKYCSSVIVEDITIDEIFKVIDKYIVNTYLFDYCKDMAHELFNICNLKDNNNNYMVNRELCVYLKMIVDELPCQVNITYNETDNTIRLIDMNDALFKPNIFEVINIFNAIISSINDVTIKHQYSYITLDTSKSNPVIDNISTFKTNILDIPIEYHYWQNNYI